MMALLIPKSDRAPYQRFVTKYQQGAGGKQSQPARSLILQQEVGNSQLTDDHMKRIIHSVLGGGWPHYNEHSLMVSQVMRQCQKMSLMCQFKPWRYYLPQSLYQGHCGKETWPQQISPQYRPLSRRLQVRLLWRIRKLQFQ